MSSKIIDCPKCGHKVSTSPGARCPQCKTSPPAKSKTNVRSFVVFSIMVLVFIWGLRSCAGCGSDKSIAPSAQEVVIDASDLWRAYDQNEVLADSQYKGKKIEVHGLIQDISVGLAGGAHISLQADPNNPLADVNCTVLRPDRSPDLVRMGGGGLRKRSSGGD
jgi:hypothetical protein